MSKYTRRDFIRTGGIVAAGILFFPGCAIKEEDSSYRFFTNKEAECVIALCEQIIPEDEEFGGATEAEVIYYIDRQLLGVFKDHASIYRENLVKLQAYCVNKFGKQFQDLSSNRQIDIMKLMEKNKIEDGEWKKPSIFFKMLLKHTMQGFYGSPIHGGNKDYMSFNMLKMDYPLNIGQNRYKKPLHEQ